MLSQPQPPLHALLATCEHAPCTMYHVASFFAITCNYPLNIWPHAFHVTLRSTYKHFPTTSKLKNAHDIIKQSPKLIFLVTMCYSPCPSSSIIMSTNWHNHHQWSLSCLHKATMMLFLAGLSTGKGITYKPNIWTSLVREIGLMLALIPSKKFAVNN